MKFTDVFAALIYLIFFFLKDFFIMLDHTY